MTSNELWHVSADVNAYIARYHPNTTQLQQDEDFWTSTFQNEAVSMNIFDEASNWITYARFSNPIYGDGWLLGVHKSSNSGAILFHGIDTRAFREKAMIFSITRERCHGQWNISLTNISLIAGHCDPEEFSGKHVNSKLWDGIFPYTLDTLPILYHTLGDAGFHSKRSNSPWKMPSYATAAALSFWARGNWQIIEVRKQWNNSALYQPIKEKIISKRPTLQAHPLLYFMLALQPFLAILALATAIILYDTPISVDFGLKSILAGIKQESLGLLYGAGLSGKVNKVVVLNISTEQGSNERDQRDLRIRYELRLNRENNTRDVLQWMQKYY